MKTLKDYIVNENNFFKNLGIGQVKFIKEWLDERNIKKYKINDDLTIDVIGEVYIYGNQLEDGKLPDYIQFGKVDGAFGIFDSGLSGHYIHSLRGCPKLVKGRFNIRAKYLRTLEGCPEKVIGEFNCSFCNDLTSLEGCPKEVSGDFVCYRGKHNFSLKHIKQYCKKIGGEIYNKLSSK
jgi:hypothetical protein